MEEEEEEESRRTELPILEVLCTHRGWTHPESPGVPERRTPRGHVPAGSNAGLRGGTASTETEATEEQHAAVPRRRWKTCRTGCERGNARDHGGGPCGVPGHAKTSTASQSILLPGRRTYEEGNDPEEGSKTSTTPPLRTRRSPPESGASSRREPAISRQQRGADCQFHDEDFIVDDVPYREPGPCASPPTKRVPRRRQLSVFHGLLTTAAVLGGDSSCRCASASSTTLSSTTTDVAGAGCPSVNTCMDVLMDCERRRYNSRD